MSSELQSNPISHSSFLIGQIPKLNDNNKVDWVLGVKTYLKGRKLWKYIDRVVELTEDESKDIDKVEHIEAEKASVLEVIRATISESRKPTIRGIEDPKIAYKTLIERVSQDDGLEVAALIAQIATIRYSSTDSITSFLDNIKDLHTQLAQATATDPELRISDKLLAVFLLLSFPGDAFSTIRDQLFGELKTLSTAKVNSRLRTKSALSYVDETPIAMAAVANKPQTRQTPSAPYRSDKSPSAPCVVKEHWPFTHTNGECSKQQRRANRSTTSSAAPKPNKTSDASNVSNDEKVRRYNQLVASGVVSFNTSAQNTTSSEPAPPSTESDETQCQFATAYNTVAGTSQSTSMSSKPIYADTACNRHMFSDEHFLEDLHEISPTTISVANEDRSSSVVATRMGTVDIKGFDQDGSPTTFKLRNVLYAPALPANLISVSSLYSSGFRTVDPHYGQKTSDSNLYYSNDIVTLPAYKENSPSGFWEFHHSSAPRAYSTSIAERSDTDLWHLRFGHLNHRSTISIMENVMGSSPSPSSNCEACVLGKQTRTSHSGTLPRSSVPLY